MRLDSVSQDIRYAARTLRRTPGFAFTAVLILALGIGANTAIFSLVNAVLVRPLPLEEPDRLVTLWVDLSAAGVPGRLSPAPAHFVDWKERSRSFQDMAMLDAFDDYNLTGEGEPDRLAGVRTTANLFSLLGLQPLVGRTFAADDEGPTASPVVVVSEELWKSRFGGDPGLVGRTINLDGLGHTVIGIVPSDFKFPKSSVGIWVPLSLTPEQLASRRNDYSMHVVARLAPGVTLSEAQAEMTTIALTLEQERPADGARVTVAALQEHLALDARPTLLILLGAVGIVLLITCANVANLLLARGAVRLKELAVRQALGAAQARILRQLITESAVLGGLGVLVGLGLSVLSFGYLARLIPSTFPDGAAPSLDWRVLLFTGGITLLTVFLFGAGPALVAARRSFVASLKQGVGRGSTARTGRMRDALVVGEIMLTIVLLAAAGLLLRSYAAVLGVDPGFRAENLLIAETVLSPGQYSDAAARDAFYRRVLERVNALPAVVDAAYVNFPPLVFKGGRMLITIDGLPPPPRENFARYIASDRVASTEYLATLGVPLLRGRHFDERDATDASRSVVINQTLARLHWPDRDPIGARLKLGTPQTEGPWYTVIGVVGDVTQMGLDLPPDPEMYFSFDQPPSAAPFMWPRHLIVRTVGDPMALAASVRSAVWEVDPDQPVSSVRAMSEILDAELTNRNTPLTLVGGFAVIALLLAAVGLYGVLSYTVAQRTAEFGLRMALGARRGNVVNGVLRGTVLMAILGIALGLAGAFGVTRLLSSFLFGVSATDPVTFAAVPMLLLVVAAIASYVPARRAANVDPVVALRSE